MRIVLFASLLATMMTQAPATVRTVPAVDLDRYAGAWRRRLCRAAYLLYFASNPFKSGSRLAFVKTGESVTNSTQPRSAANAFSS